MSSKAVAIYARVSTDKQNVDMQLSQLRDFVKRSGWKLYKEFIDEGFTGKHTARPAFAAMMKEAGQKKFDVLLVWKLDRLGRSLKDLINTLDELGHLGVAFVSYDDRHLNTTTPAGMLMFHMIAAVAEFEREIIRERVIAGLENARRKGKQLGRRPVPPYVLEKARELRAQGLSFAKIGKRLGVSGDVIRKRLPCKGYSKDFSD